MSRTIGIDLGTTNSVVAFMEGDRYETIPNAEGSKTTPSVVLFTPEEVIVGELAKRQTVTQPGQVIRSVKRIMGKRYEDVTEHEREDLPFEIVALENGMAAVRIGDGQVLRPEEVSARILYKMRETAERFLDTDVEDAVITVPAHFNDQQRTATKLAAEAAGLNVLRIVNEPTAAALAYGYGREGGRHRDERVAVFDFGGGTFDVSILEISKDIFEVISTGGDNHLGGDDVDNRLVQEICDGILAQTSIDPTQDPQSLQRIREAAEKAKCDLSSMNSTQISLPFIVADSSGPKHFNMELDRAKFNALMEPLFQRLLAPCRQALADAGVGPEKIDHVLLVGGSTRIPRVQELVEEFFGQPPNRSVNPDEVVACGAAVQSGVVSGSIREVLLLDVTPLTLGLEVAGGIFKPLIQRNSTLPCEASKKFTTVVDNQTSVMVHVLQGERSRATENHSLAKFRLTGIAPAPKELPEIEVRFNIDANGILSVSALDLATGMETGVVVEDYGEMGLTKDQIESIVSSARDHQADDEAYVRFSSRRQESERLQDRANKIIAALGEDLVEADLKLLKESLLKLDLAMMDMDTRKMESFEDIIVEVLEKYKEKIENLRTQSQEFSIHSDFALPGRMQEVLERKRPKEVPEEELEEDGEDIYERDTAAVNADEIGLALENAQIIRDDDIEPMARIDESVDEEFEESATPITVPAKIQELEDSRVLPEKKLPARQPAPAKAQESPKDPPGPKAPESSKPEAPKSEAPKPPKPKSETREPETYLPPVEAEPEEDFDLSNAPPPPPRA